MWTRGLPRKAADNGENQAKREPMCAAISKAKDVELPNPFLKYIA